MAQQEDRGDSLFFEGDEVRRQANYSQSNPKTRVAREVLKSRASVNAKGSSLGGEMMFGLQGKQEYGESLNGGLPVERIRGIYGTSDSKLESWGEIECKSGNA